MEDFKIDSYISEGASSLSGEQGALFGDELNIELLMIEVSRDFAKRDFFCPDCVETAVNHNGKPFLGFFSEKNSISESEDAAGTITAMVGRRGAGKSSFLRWWRSGNAPDSSYILDIETVRAASPVGSGKIGSFMTDYFCVSIRDYYQNLEEDDKKLFGSYFRELAEAVAETSGPGEIDPGFLDTASEPGDSVLLLAVLVGSINIFLGKPVWFFIDNIDLETAETRREYILKSSRLHSKLVHLAGKNGIELHFNILLPVRPETYTAAEHGSGFGTVISYPFGDVPTIFLKKIRQSIVNVLEKFYSPEGA